MKSNFIKILSLFCCIWSMNLSVSAQKNLSLNKTCKASSTEGNKSEFHPKYAVDGYDGWHTKENPNIFLTQSNSKGKPWWEVDLGNFYTISSIEIKPLRGEVFKKYYVLIGDQPFPDSETLQSEADLKKCVTFVKTEAGNGSNSSFEKTISVPNITGRYVRIQSVEIQGFNQMAIREVEVMGNATPVSGHTSTKSPWSTISSSDSGGDSGGDSSGGDSSGNTNTDNEYTSKDGKFKPSKKPTNQSYKNEIVNGHNRVRKEAGSGNIEWWDELALSVQEWAEFCSFRDKWVHESAGFPENIGSLELWENEKAFFNEIGGAEACWKSTKYNDCGHYANVIGPDTKYIGCAKVKNGPWITHICRYAATKSNTPLKNPTVEKYKEGTK